MNKIHKGMFQLFCYNLIKQNKKEIENIDFNNLFELYRTLFESEDNYFCMNNVNNTNEIINDISLILAFKVSCEEGFKSMVVSQFPLEMITLFKKKIVPINTDVTVNKFLLTQNKNYVKCSNNINVLGQAIDLLVVLPNYSKISEFKTPDMFNLNIKGAIKKSLILQGGNDNFPFYKKITI